MPRPIRSHMFAALVELKPRHSSLKRCIASSLTCPLHSTSRNANTTKLGNLMHSEPSDRGGRNSMTCVEGKGTRGIEDANRGLRIKRASSHARYCIANSAISMHLPLAIAWAAKQTSASLSGNWSSWIMLKKSLKETSPSPFRSRTRKATARSTSEAHMTSKNCFCASLSSISIAGISRRCNRTADRNTSSSTERAYDCMPLRLAFAILGLVSDHKAATALSALAIRFNCSHAACAIIDPSLSLFIRSTTSTGVSGSRNTHHKSGRRAEIFWAAAVKHAATCEELIMLLESWSDKFLSRFRAPSCIGNTMLPMRVSVEAITEGHSKVAPAMYQANSLGMKLLGFASCTANSRSASSGPRSWLNPGAISNSTTVEPC
mmetsp:Transcript_35507/g.55165  ORF Transcript_35507/g.55165 Transcript_35507/m.55165 type:complete len:376 (-) Transcript_35507:1312-2439(-)